MVKKKKSSIINFIIAIIFCIADIALLCWGDCAGKCALSNICGVILGLLLPYILACLQDCTDTTSWSESLRNLIRAKIISPNDKIRISFAYLFRIMVDGKYLLVANERGTGKYQPVGGAYKFNDSEREYLIKTFHVTNDEKIVQDRKSKNDYRLYVPAKYLKRFVKRFNKSTQHEQIDNLGREFKEELLKTDILISSKDFSTVKYRYCGRHFSDVCYSRVFRCYELLLADIVELKPTEQQEMLLRELLDKNDKKCFFASPDEIRSCGVKAGTSDMHETIADHTEKILQETEENLVSKKELVKDYCITI